MRIDAYNQISKIYDSKQTARTREVARTKARDELTISSTGRDYQVARQALNNVPDIREDKVAAIKSRMADGSYQVSADSFAAKVIAKYEEMSL